MKITFWVVLKQSLMFFPDPRTVSHPYHRFVRQKNVHYQMMSSLVYSTHRLIIRLLLRRRRLSQNLGLVVHRIHISQYNGSSVCTFMIEHRF